MVARISENWNKEFFPTPCSSPAPSKPHAHGSTATVSSISGDAYAATLSSSSGKGLPTSMDPR